MQQIRFTTAARKHRIGKASVRHVMATVTPAGTVTSRGNQGWLYVGPDDRGRWLEVIAVEVPGHPGQPDVLLVIQVMPVTLRSRGDSDA